MAPVIINSFVQLPVQIVTLVLRKLRLVPTGSASHHTFPVAGLDEARAHAVLYALRQAALDAQVTTLFNPVVEDLASLTCLVRAQDKQTAELWLVAVQLAQIASDRCGTNCARA